MATQSLAPKSHLITFDLFKTVVQDIRNSFYLYHFLICSFWVSSRFCQVGIDNVSFTFMTEHVEVQSGIFQRMRPKSFGFVFCFHFHLMANLKITRNKLKMSFQSLKLPSKLPKSKNSKSNQRLQDQKFPSRCSLVLRWHLWLTKRVSSHPARVFEIFD